MFIKQYFNHRTHSDQNFLVLLFLSLLINIPGIFLPIIEPDSALYATIAKHMVQEQDWVNLFGNGSDWLDKPHFPFWVSAISYTIFGINGFAYKLPAFLFWLVGLRFTYLIGQKLYNTSVGQIAVLIQATALHNVLANFDVRAEPYLTTCILGAVWYLLHLQESFKYKYVLLAAAWTAFAMMTKGVFVLISIGSGFVLYWLVTRRFKEFWELKYWLYVAVSLLFLFPEIYSLYVQFDLHPEKLVFGEYGVSGVRFFFWDSQFGRFFNTGPIKGSGDPFFFVHTTLWAFLPWTIPFIIALFYRLQKSLSHEPKRWVIVGSVIVTFLLFSFSKFQLPHYIIICFPFMAMLAANVIWELRSSPEWLQKLVWAQKAILLLVVLLVALLSYWIGFSTYWHLILVSILAVGINFSLRFKSHVLTIVSINTLTMGYLAFFLFFSFYPFLFQYQSGSESAKVLVGKYAKLPTGSYQSFSYAFEFYAPGEVKLLQNKNSLSAFIQNKPFILYTNKSVADSLRKVNPDYQILRTTEHFHITKLKGTFFNQNSRNSTLEKRVLLYLP